MASHAIDVSNLTRTFRIPVIPSGFVASLQSIIHRSYRTVTAVDTVSFSIDQGELIGFIGPNGAGKTTTLKMLTGLMYPTSGSVSVLGFTPSDRKHEYLKQISLVMGQKAQLWIDLPARDSFLLNKYIYEIPEDQYKTTLGSFIELLDLQKLMDVQVRKLSLGERMKMEIVAALLHRPKVIFLDEPTIGLDVVMQKQLREFIKEYNEKFHATVILTSHYMQDVKALCQRVVVIDHGVILFDGSLSTLVNSHAGYKEISVVLDTPIQKDVLNEFGKVTEFHGTDAVIRVENSQVRNSASAILKKLSVADVTIKEPDLEDVVRDVYSKNKHGDNEKRK
jgi:ABC-2 type transport system ATP-binding protein